MAARKAARVLPDPVGAGINAGRPLAIAGQASSCARVAPPAKVLANHAWTAGWNWGKGMAEPYIGPRGGSIQFSSPATTGYSSALRARQISREQLGLVPYESG